MIARTTRVTRAFGMRALLALLFVSLLPVAPSPPVRAADAPALPFAGDDTFQIGPLVIADGGTVTLRIDRAYGPLADAAGHLALRLIGGPVAANADLDVALVAPADAPAPAPRLIVAVNGVPMVGEWLPAVTTASGDARRGVYRLAVPTAHLLFPAPGDATAPLTPRLNTLTFSGPSSGERTALAGIRLTVPGAPPVLYMAGADTNCGTPGVQPVAESFGSWAGWLATDGVPFVAPDRDGHLSVAEQVRYLDLGYAQIVRTYGPDRPDVSPRVTLVGFSMGGLVARQWAAMHPGLAVNLVTVATPNNGTDAVSGLLARFTAGCAAGVLRDLAPAAFAAFNSRYDLGTYGAPANARVVSVAAVPVQGARTDGVVTEASALALPYATKIVWTPAPGTRTFGPLHALVMHAEPVYRDVRAVTQFALPLRDPRTET